MNGWMDCTGIMKYLSLGLLILDMAVYLGGSAAEDQQPLFVPLTWIKLSCFHPGS